MTAPSPLTELIAYLRQMAGQLRARRRFGDLLHTEVALDIAADAAAQQARAAHLAYTAQQADIEAEQIMRTVLHDNRVTADEIPVLKQALRHVHNSATTDCRIVEQLK